MKQPASLNASPITSRGGQCFLFVPQVAAPVSSNLPILQVSALPLTVAKRGFFKNISPTSEGHILNGLAGISGHTENLSAHDTGTVHSSRLPTSLFGTRFAYEPITTRYFHGKPS